MHIVISGANRGIGLEFCRWGIEQGHQVTALCRKASDELKELTLSIVEGVEVKNPPNLDQVANIDWLLLNAGIWRNESLEDMDFESITEQFEVNSLGPLRLFDKLSDKLSEGSKLGLMTSQMGSMTDNSSGGRYGYRLSKAALNCIGVSMAHDLKSRGVAVALLHPGYVATDMTQHKGTISPKESVSGLTQVMSGLSLENTGTFWNYRGEILPW